MTLKPDSRRPFDRATTVEHAFAAPASPRPVGDSGTGPSSDRPTPTPRSVRNFTAASSSRVALVWTPKRNWSLTARFLRRSLRERSIGSAPWKITCGRRSSGIWPRK